VLNFNVHNAEVSSIAVHPTGNYITSTSHDGSWSILDVSGHQSRLLRKVAPQDGGVSSQITDIDGTQVTRNNNALLCGKFHPDGILLGTGSVAASQGIQLWDIRSADQKSVLQLNGHNSSVFDISFCENGYLVASAGGDGTVKVWDLRKGTCLKSIGGSPNVMPSRVSWDSSGVYLASSFTNFNTNIASVQVCAVKEYVNLLPESAMHTKAITSLLWANYANTLITTSIDRTLKVHSVNK
jgi:WD40 repeat protein